MTRKFLLTSKCHVCARRVRIYDWLPDSVLCAKCAARIARDEAKAQEIDR